MSFPYDKYAGFWIRFFAAIIDSIVLFFPFLVLSSVIFYQVTGMSQEQYMNMMFAQNANNEMYVYYPPMEVSGWTILAQLIVGILYFAGMTSSKWQATFGKMVFRIKIVSGDGGRIGFWHAVVRYFGYTVSAIILFFGYIMVGIDDRKQGLHDKIAGTFVIHANKGNELLKSR